MPLGWAVSGTGDIINKAVAPAIVAQPDSRLVSFFSRHENRGREFAEKFGAARSTTDFDAFLADPEVQVVYVGGEVDRHCSETVAAAEAGKHVVCEKPMATDAAECRRMIEACDANGVQLAIAYYRRYYPATNKLKELLAAGAIGRPLQAAIDTAGYYHPAKDDPKYWRVSGLGGGGALMDIGSHRLDILCWLLGEPVEVAGFASRLVHDYVAPDTETLIVKFDSGAHATCRCNWAAGASEDTFRIIGSEGMLSIGAFEATEFLLRRRGKPDKTIEVKPVAENRHYPLIDDITRRLLAGKPVTHNGQAGYQASRIIDGCYRSEQLNQVVEV